ncbi:MAG: thioether cross-link-forming SCIFF peptide maturase [Clostridiales bacterium]|jgi:uncharacterized protein|nr:thioether cross-link-forming SCIFF peptide maturase [Clostridiales bacterium]
MIHKFTAGGLFFLVDTASGSIHAADEAVYDIASDFETETAQAIIRKYKTKYSEAEIAECLEELTELKNAGTLYSRDIYENIPLKELGKPVVKALCMHMAHDCNLKCGYCFGAGGAFNGEKQLMSLDTAKEAINFVIKNSGSRKNLEIDFFGGEPLMNLNVIKETVAYARQKEKEHGKKFNFTLTTNGVLLGGETNRFINENMQNVVLSLDGRKEVNDNMRKTANSAGSSYDIIVPKFLELVKARDYKNYYVRATFTADNLDFSNDALHLARLGFKEISVEPVVADETLPYALKGEHLDEIYRQYEILAQKMAEANKEGNGFNFFHFNIDLEGGPCVYKRLAGCGAGTEYLAVTPSGDLYPCHQLVGKSEYLLGSVYTGITNTEAGRKFRNTNVYTKPNCKNCWAKFICGGGCIANAVNTNGNLETPYEYGCKLMKKRIECAILYKYYLSEQNIC